MRPSCLVRRPARRLCPLLIVTAALIGCTSAPPPGTGLVWGDLRLVPREGVAPSGGGASYGDRRLRDVELVDYSQPGFAVVYADAAKAPAGEVAVAIRASRFGVALHPARVAVGAAGRVELHNETPETHVVSHPAAGRLVEIAPGGTVDFALPEAGAQQLYLLDAPAASAMVFAAPGPYAVVRASGRFELPGLAPGRHVLHAWHPRFPPASRAVEVRADVRTRVDFALGVGVSKDQADAD